MAAREAGFSSVSDFLDLDAFEADGWMDFVFSGPSNLQTQILLARLIQIVQGALGGKAPAIEDLLPWYEALSGKKKESARERAMRLGRERMRAMLDSREDSK